MIIRHEFDSEWLLLMFEENEDKFYEMRKQLLAKSLECSKENMERPDETNRYSFGKVRLKIKRLKNIPNIGKLFFRIKLGPFSIESRRLKGPTESK